MEGMRRCTVRVNANGAAVTQSASSFLKAKILTSNPTAQVSLARKGYGSQVREAAPDSEFHIATESNHKTVRNALDTYPSFFFFKEYLAILFYYVIHFLNVPIFKIVFSSKGLNYNSTSF